MIAQRLLHALKAKQVEMAQAALEQPRGHDSFEYGRAVGFYAGLQAALDEVNHLLSEDAD